MRVVAGTYKGRRLTAPRGSSTRPTQDKVREAVFNLLGPIEGARVLDLYAGSGALGVEALSRGAAAVTFVESDAAALRAIRSNLELVGAEEGKVVRANVVSFLAQAARRGESWDLAFCDPPYRLAHRLGRDLGELLPPVLAPEARIVCESSGRHPLELQLPLLKQRRYGNTVIAVYTPPQASGAPEAAHAG
jgi:16S rRNA (guanine966-N2)-methyltransferase